MRQRPWPIAHAIGTSARRRNLHPIVTRHRNLHPIVTRHRIPSLMKFAG